MKHLAGQATHLGNTTQTKLSMKKLLSLFLVALMIALTMPVFDDSAVIAEVPDGPLTADRDADEFISIGDKPTFCLDFDTEFFPNTDYLPADDIVIPAVLFIINNSFPVLDVDQVNFLWNLTPPLTGTSAEKNAYHAAQGAIWTFTNPDKISSILDEIPTAAKSLYDKLVAAAAAYAVSYTPMAERFTIRFEGSSSPAGSMTTGGMTRFGPYKIVSDGDKPIPDGLRVQVSQTGGDVPEAFGVYTGAGVAYTDDIVPLDEEFYVHVNTGFDGSLDMTFALTTSIPATNGFIWLPYVTEAMYLQAVTQSGETAKEMQKILFYDKANGTPPPSLSASITNVPPPLPTSAGFTIEKAAASNSSDSSYGFDVYVVKGSEVISVTLTPSSVATGGTITYAFSAQDISDYFTKGYDVVIIEKWENFTNKTIATDKLETRNTSVDGISTTNRRYYPLSAGMYSLTGETSTRPSNSETNIPSYYAGYRFSFDELIETSITISFTNTVTEKDPPNVTLTKADTSSHTDTAFTFHLYERTGSNTYTFIKTYSSIAKGGVISTIFADLETEYGQGGYYGRTFAIIEAFENKASASWEEGAVVTTITGGTRYYYSLNAETPPGPRRSSGSPTNLTTTYKYPGVEFSLTDSNVSLTFKNDVNAAPAKPIIRVRKSFSTDSTRIFDFYLYHMDKNTNVHTYIGAFSLKHNEITPNTNNSTSDIFGMINDAFENHKISAYIGETFIIVEDYPVVNDLSSERNYTAASLTSGSASNWQMRGYNTTDGVGLTTIGQTPGNTATYTSRGDYSNTSVGQYPAYEFVMNASLSGSYTITFTNTKVAYKQPELKLAKSADGAGNLDTADDGFSFNLYEVVGNNYTLLHADIVAKRGDTGAAAIDLTTYFTGEYWNKTYALIENFKFDDDPLHSWWQSTDISPSVENGAVAAFTKYGYSAIPGGPTATLDVDFEKGTNQTRDLCYPGCEFKLQGPDTTNTPVLTITFTNIEADAAHKKININKVNEAGDAFTSSALASAAFAIFENRSGDEVGQEFVSGDRTSPLAEFNSVNDFKPSFSFIRGAKYTIVETSVPGGTDPAAAGTVVWIGEVTYDLLDVQTIDIKNQRLGSIELHKKNSKGEAYLPGAVFALYQWEEAPADPWDPATYADKTPVIPPFTITEAAAYTLENLPYGQYALIEILPPTGYVLVDDKRVTYINHDGDVVSGHTAYYINNYPASEMRLDLKILKVDEFFYSIWDSQSDPMVLGLTGAEFAIQAMTGGSWYPFGLLTESSSIPGLYSYRPDNPSPGLNLGRYRITETVAPDGYIPNPGVYYYFEVAVKEGILTATPFEEGTEFDVTVTEKDMERVNGATFVVTNTSETQPTGSLILEGTKTINNGAPGNATFTFKVAEGETEVAWGTVTGSGKISFSPIPYTEAGDHIYVISEDAPPSRWTRNTQPITIYVTVTGNTDRELVATAYKDAAFTEEITDIAAYLTFSNTYSRGGGGDEPPPGGGGTTPPDGDTDSDTDTDTDSDTDTGGGGGGGGGGEEPGGPPEEYIEPPDVPTGHILVPDGDGFIQLDEDGTPLGRWEWDPELEEWIFDEFVPLGMLPPTGDNDVRAWLFFLSMLILGCAGMPLMMGVSRRGRHERS